MELRIGRDANMQADSKRINEAPTLQGKFIEVCRSSSPIPLLLKLTDHYRKHRPEEWRTFWHAAVSTTHSSKRGRIVRLLKKITPTIVDVHELLHHPWWRRFLLTHRMFIRVVARTAQRRTALVQWLLRMNYYLEAWYQTFMFLPARLSLDFGQPRYTTTPLDCSLVTPELFGQVASILYSLLEKMSRPDDPVAVLEERDYYHRGWRSVEQILRERNISIRKKKVCDADDVAHIYRIVPRPAKKILEIDRALQDAGWRSYVRNRPLRRALLPTVPSKNLMPFHRKRAA